ncbi:MAG: hypothetical protein ACRDTI_20675 [Mycobacterium sp.]
MTAAAFLGLDRDNPPPYVDDAGQALLRDLKSVIRRQSEAHPRSQQKVLGPSEIGHPCARKLAASMLELERINPDSDPLPSWMGTAGHSRFEEAIEAENRRMIDAFFARDLDAPVGTAPRCTFREGKPVGRWFAERRVTIRPGLAGTCDLFDTWTNTVIDLKFPGATAHTKYKKSGPSPEYRTQAHAYGKGYANEGFPVERVAIWFIPRGGMLSQSMIWTEPYDEKIVSGCLTKLDNITVLLDDLQIEKNPALLQLVPTTPSNCRYCPFWTPNPGPSQPHGCKGDG